MSSDANNTTAAATLFPGDEALARTFLSQARRVIDSTGGDVDAAAKLMGLQPETLRAWIECERSTHEEAASR